MKKHFIEWLAAAAALAAALGAAAFVVHLLPQVVDKPRILQCAPVPQQISFAEATIDPRFNNPTKPVLRPAKARK